MLAPILALLAIADAGLGTKDPGLYSLKGQIYFLDEGTDRMPEDLAKRKVEGVIYTSKLDVPSRSFEEGFPGVTSRFEWFGLLYTGTFEVKTPGKHRFKVISDDGSRVWIDQKELIDNDGIHGADEKEGEVDLKAGRHAIKVWYFQGPATEIALQLFVTAPGGKEKIFEMEEWAGAAKAAAKGLDAQATPEGIKIDLDAAVLFDSGKHDLKPAAKKVLKQVTDLLAAYPGATLTIVGHTDDEGDDAANQALSERRAAAVKSALEGAGLPKTSKVETSGMGERAPIADNKTPKGRAKNRRVEILVKP